MRVLHIVGDLLFPPRCVKCKGLMPPGSEVFCEGCTASWREAYAPCCREDADGADATVYLAAYRKDHPTGAVERLVYHVKHEGSRRVLNFVVARIAEHLPAIDGTPIVTYPPRRRAAIRRDGFDQAARMARCLASQVDGELETLLCRARRGWREQKRLDGEARRQNADAAFLPCRDLEARVKGRTVILVDDLTTTGATLAACTTLLRTAGATRVIWATIAKNERV